MKHSKVHRDGWSSAMAPIFLTPPAGCEYVSYRDKVKEADRLRARVKAHIASGGAFFVLPCHLDKETSQ